jgi:hypothetical protein
MEAKLLLLQVLLGIGSRRDVQAIATISGRQKEVAERSWRTPYLRYTCTTLLRHFFPLLLLGLINNP